MRILIGEDGALFREGLSALLSARGHQIVAAVANTDDMIDAVADHQPDILIADIRMPSATGLDGASAAALLRQRFPDLAVLLLSQHIELRHCRPLIGTPRFGYLLKDRVLEVDDFEQSLNRVCQGGTALDPEVVRSLVRASEPDRLRRLSGREHEVLACVAQGHANSAIARLLHLSDRTVETHMRSIFQKLDLADDGNAHRRVSAVIAYLNAQQHSVSWITPVPGEN